MALRQRVKIGILVAVVVALPLSNVAVVAGAIDWKGPLPDLSVVMTSLQLVSFAFAAIGAAARCDAD